ncbi:ATP phosphoribosyltransferase [Aliarcobacter cryaerophilus]|jgi:ATP phosphoribosyltransferase|uniref:ATP phosphoribosyltransferase n=7 Tax=Arcobacteraceae TaxID=2808963 RepID=A0A2S9T508_9BACT|nr:ATP phosphoribosyltransferase [Aliarcobacter cryaerophilus]MBK6302633.1 ATP phosphoribosyltransferase [Arcobacter sp.]OQA74188.1 MAG: ATP phosphoribosyltransferase [Candidatus Dependentiae bacterium ADurb.Bin246]WNL12858.1 ATP phosphoribosyltransferase [Arcobacter sp. AZ-2023]WPD04314.1 ATP phosphoribosyltransferase [Arcobacter sp. DSM 115972]WPD06301.1 ATP phosphoribosyltransferase [Arcobacter sp. DSM 115956]WPD08392.1 ATP phosphoribosyltransferase [Arcobacter sp. DSM 115955]WPD09344.1 A
MLTIALPKGRIADETLDRFEKAFGEKFVFEDRKLILEKSGFKFLNVRNQDVPTYVMHGAADLGVVGLDVLEEKEYDLIKLLDLKLGRCKVAFGLRAGEKLNFDKSKITIATKHEKIAKKYFEQKAMAVEIIKLYGSIELAPLVGLCDCIVDIVETGETMKQNGLEVGPTIMETTAHLIANKNSFYAKKDLIFDLKDKLEKFL